VGEREVHGGQLEMDSQPLPYTFLYLATAVYGLQRYFSFSRLLINSLRNVRVPAAECEKLLLLFRAKLITDCPRCAHLHKSIVALQKSEIQHERHGHNRASNAAPQQRQLGKSACSRESI
jgi:phage FluMu protein Com